MSHVNSSACCTYVYLLFFTICQVNPLTSSVYFEQEVAASCIHAAEKQQTRLICGKNVRVLLTHLFVEQNDRDKTQTKQNEKIQNRKIKAQKVTKAENISLVVATLFLVQTFPCW